MRKKSLKIVLLDDELLALSYLRTLCESIEEVEVVKVYDDSEKFLSELASLDFDCCISDIVMPKHTGLQVAEQLGKKAFIFCSAHNEYAADAYDVEAIDYLRKPVQRERLVRALDKARVFIQNQTTEGAWLVHTTKGKISIPMSSILVFSSDALDRRDKLLRLKTGEEFIIKNKSFDQILSELKNLELIRISKSELLVGLTIQQLIQNEIHTTIKQKDGTFLKYTVGENYLKTVRESLPK
jgi:two-component system, LytTR family, response regulator